MGRFAMKAPCDSCPFRRGPGAVPLRRARLREIGGNMLNSSGVEFACHKTTTHDEDGNHVPKSKELHCAGALIFAEKNGNATQMMRIAERIGMYDPDELKPHHDQVFDDLEEMTAAGMDAPGKRGKRRA